jgi:hypothetical protein
MMCEYSSRPLRPSVYSSKTLIVEINSNLDLVAPEFIDLLRPSTTTPMGLRHMIEFK